MAGDLKKNAIYGAISADAGGAIYYHLVGGKLMKVQSVLEDGDRTYVAEGPALVPGQGCPMCGKRVGRDAKQRQKEWRARKSQEAQ